MANALQRQIRATGAARGPIPIAAGAAPARWAAVNAGRDLAPVWRLLVDRGSAEMAAPGVSALDHALCCANLALEAGAAPELVTASLLHDIGHLLREDFQVAPGAAGRDRHAMIGAAFLSLWFGPGVTEPVRLHSEAKRYLCAVEPGYAGRLHAGARSSLARNGGPMSAEEARTFLDGAHAREALLLRRWDDRAADARRGAADIARFQKLARRCLA